MKSSLTRGVLVALVFAQSLVCASSAFAQEAAGTRTVRFTAVERDGARVMTLRREDVRVVAEGEAQELSAFELEQGVPLALTFLIDVSASQEKVLDATKRAAVALLTTTLRDGVDRVAVVSFTGEPTLEQSLTGDLVKARRAVERLVFVAPVGYMGGGIIIGGGPPGKRDKNQPPLPGATALWDAVWATCDDLLGMPRPGERRVILLLSDGVDTSSVKKSDEAIREAVKAGVAVYAVGIADKEFTDLDKGALRKLSERTGGRVFFPKTTGELLSIFEQVRRELSVQYAATFTPKRPAHAGAFQKLRVELVNPEMKRREVRLLHPEGYFAGAAKP